MIFTVFPQRCKAGDKFVAFVENYYKCILIALCRCLKFHRHVPRFDDGLLRPGMSAFRVGRQPRIVFKLHSALPAGGSAE